MMNAVLVWATVIGFVVEVALNRLRENRRQNSRICRRCRSKPRLIYRDTCIDCFYHEHRN